MSVAEAVQTTAKATSSSSSGFVLQRKCACGGSAGLTGECATCRTNKLLGKPLQAKLRVSAPSDEYEQEADRMAEEVMRMPDGLADPGGSPTSTVPLVQGRVNGVGATGFSTAPQIVHDVLNSPGQPLDAATRTFFEPRFGHDLAHVRVHNDGRAQLAAESVHARAFTVGPHIVFGAGEYVPKSIASRQLLAHEVTHAIQQTGGHVPSNVTQSPGSVANTISPTHSASVIARKASPAFPQGDHVADQSVTPSTMRPSVVASTAGLDQSAVAVAEEVIGAQVDALFGEQAATDTDESGRLSTTLTHDRREDEDEEIAIEEITSIQAKSSIPGEGEQPNQPAEEISEPKGIAFGPAASSMTSGSAYEPATASIALAMPITSPSETGRWFNGLPLTVQAEHYEQLGVALSGSLVHQAVETQEGIPELSASLDGVTELPATPDIATPPVMPSVAGRALAMAPEPLVNIPQAPALQPVDASALPMVQSAEPEALARSLGTIEQAPAIVTTLETPEIPLEGKADPAALEQLESAATGEAHEALDAAQAGVMVVTPETLQLLALDETVAPPALSDVSAPDQPLKIEGMDKLAGYGLSSQDRAIVDAQLGPSMQEQTAGAQAELDQHEQAFNQERARLHLEADAEAEAAQAKAEEEQSLEVEQGRQDLAIEQEQTLEQQQTAVDGALGQLAASQQASRQAIDDRLADDRALVDEAYAAAQVDAKARVEEGKAEADVAKSGTINKVQASSWWDWAIDTWQAVVQMVATAVIAIGERIVKEVAGIFDKAIAFATQVVNNAVAFTKRALSAYYDFWTGLVDKLFGNIFPGFAAAFRKAVESLKAKVFEALDTVAAKYLQTLRVVADTLVAGLNAGLEAYKAGVAAYVALWEAIQNGQWEEVGKTILTPILRAAGIDPEEFFATFGKIDEVIDDVIANPGLVGQNAVAALGLGFKQFGTNFIGNFTVTFVEWITGTARIRLPETFGIAGIFQVVCDVLNLTKAYLRKKAVQHLGEGAVTAVEELTELAWATVSGGWAGLWDLVKGKLTTLVDDVVVATGTWLVEKAILVAGRWIAGLAATMGLSVILEALIALWQFVMWLKDQFQRFWMIIKSTVDSVHDFVKGNIEPAANKIEGTLQDLIVPAIDLVAKLLNISNIAKKVEQIIEAVRSVIDQAIDSVIERMKKMFKAGAKKVKEKATEVGSRLFNWWHARSEFKDTSGEEHKLFYMGEGDSAKLYVASREPKTIGDFLGDKNQVDSNVQAATEEYKPIHDDEIKLKDAQTLATDKPGIARRLQMNLTKLGEGHLAKLFEAENEKFPPPILPVMVSGVQAMGFTADYLCKNSAGCLYPVGKKSDGDAMYKGSPPGGSSPSGWEEIQANKKTKEDTSNITTNGRRDRYIQMHLLPDSLGGLGEASNLTPALNSTNVSSGDSFKWAIETHAETQAKKEPIWYSFKIEYYSSGSVPDGWIGRYPADAYPRVLEAKWGTYEKHQDRIRRGPEGKGSPKRVQPRLPGWEELTPEEVKGAEKETTVLDYAYFIETAIEKLEELALPDPMPIIFDSNASAARVLRSRAKEGNTQQAAEIVSIFVQQVRHEFNSEAGELSNVVQKIEERLERDSSTLAVRLVDLERRQQILFHNTSNSAFVIWKNLAGLGMLSDTDDESSRKTHLVRLNNTYTNIKRHFPTNLLAVLASDLDSKRHAATLQGKLNAVCKAVSQLSREEQEFSQLEVAIKAANQVFIRLRDLVPYVEDQLNTREDKFNPHFIYYLTARRFLRRQQEANESITLGGHTSPTED